MKNRGKDWGSISTIRWCAVRVALAIATVFLLAGLAALPLLAAQAPQAETPAFTVLYAFTGGADGANPLAGLIPDAAGNLYGTTALGGDFDLNDCEGWFIPGCGVVFKLDPAGNETVLYTFTFYSDGAWPYAGLIRDSGGNLYGTAQGGGGSECSDYLPGCGVVFKLDPNGNETVLYSFSSGTDGAYPVASLIRDAAGNLYGTTSAGGPISNQRCETAESFGCGVVFKLDPTGNETVLHGFAGLSDGGVPVAGLIRDAVGNLYGTASEHGPDGHGVVFRLDQAGHGTILYGFTGGTDGADPLAGLIRDAAGNLYGTTFYGGSFGQGVVFKLDPAGNETVLHSFTGGTDGGNPEASLIRDAAGNFYSTTAFGGAHGYGVVFSLDPNGRETVLHTFTGGVDGANPGAPLIQYQGALYGTTVWGGAYGYGVVFKLTLH